MNDFVKLVLTVLVIAIIVISLTFGICAFAIHMSTAKGSFVIIPESGQPFHVREVTFVNANSVVYIKHDGTGGRISGNFRVEDAISEVLERKADNEK